MPAPTTCPGPWQALVAPPDAVLPIPSPPHGAVTLPWTTISSCGEEEDLAWHHSCARHEMKRTLSRHRRSHHARGEHHKAGGPSGLTPSFVMLSHLALT